MRVRRPSALLKRYIDAEQSSTKCSFFGSGGGAPGGGGRSARRLYTSFSPVAPSTSLVSSSSPLVWCRSHCRSVERVSAAASTTRSCASSRPMSFSIDS